jgi:hypothetical protein
MSPKSARGRSGAFAYGTFALGVVFATLLWLMTLHFYPSLYCAPQIPVVINQVSASQPSSHARTPTPVPPASAIHRATDSKPVSAHVTPLTPQTAPSLVSVHADQSPQRRTKARRKKPKPRVKPKKEDVARKARRKGMLHRLLSCCTVCMCVYIYIYINIYISVCVCVCVCVCVLTWGVCACLFVWM